MRCRTCLQALTWAYWAVALASATLTLVWPLAATLSMHGKLLPKNRGQHEATGGQLSGSLRARVAGCTVPKRLFVHFYVVCVAWSCALLCCNLSGIDVVRDMLEPVLSDALGLCERGQRLGARGADGLLPGALGARTVEAAMLGMLALHGSRRLLESLLLTRFSPSARMHASAYLIGTTFYLAAAWSIVVEIPEADGPAGSSAGTVTTARLATTAAAVVALSLEQFKSHEILARLRKAPRDATAYVIPRGRGFELVSSPHYACEVLIYAALLSLQPHSTSLRLMALFVALNLSISAARTHAWYKRKFAENYPPRRRALVPFLF